MDGRFFKNVNGGPPELQYALSYVPFVSDRAVKILHREGNARFRLFRRLDVLNVLNVEISAYLCIILINRQPRFSILWPSLPKLHFSNQFDDCRRKFPDESY